MLQLLSIDVGTSAVKAGIVSTDGVLIASATVEYSLISEGAEQAEIPPECYWESVCTATHVVLSQANHPTIAALSVSSQGETLIMLDRAGRSLRNAIVWLDNRATKEATSIGNEFSIDEYYRHTGMIESTPTWTGAKLLWLRTNEPRIFEKTAHFLNVMDYVLYRCCGEFVTEPSVCQSTAYADLATRRWWPEMLEYLHVREDQLPEIHPAGQVIGHLSYAASQELGLNSATKVVVGALDQIAGTVGAGNCVPGLITETTGTALAVVATVDHITLDPLRRIPCEPHAVSDRYTLLPYAPCAGMMLKWFRENILGSCASYDELVSQAAEIAPGSEGLVVLPHLSGSYCPKVNSSARAVFAHASLGHRQPHFIRAILESVAFLLADIIAVVQEMGTPITSIISMGGGARSDLWLQIKADILGLPIHVPSHPDTTLLGNAIFAGVGIGVWSDIASASESLAKMSKEFLPNTAIAPAYQEAHRRYKQTYDVMYG